MNIFLSFAGSFIVVFFLWLVNLVDLFWWTFAGTCLIAGAWWLHVSVRPTSTRAANILVVIAVVFGVVFILAPIATSISGYFFPRTAAVAKIAKADRDLKIAEAIRPGSFGADRAWATFCEQVAQIDEGNLETRLQKILGEIPEERAAPATKLGFQKKVREARHAIEQIRGWRADCARVVAGRPAAFHWRFLLLGLALFGLAAVPPMPGEKYLLVAGGLVVTISVAMWLLPEFHSILSSVAGSGGAEQIGGLTTAEIPEVGAMNPFMVLLLFVVVGVALRLSVWRGG